MDIRPNGYLNNLQKNQLDNFDKKNPASIIYLQLTLVLIYRRTPIPVFNQCKIVKSLCHFDLGR